MCPDCKSLNWDESGEIGEKQFKEIAPRIVEKGAGETTRPGNQTPPEASNEQESEGNWIEMPTTYENGEILYWRRKLKGKPVCYRRESDLGGA